MTATLTCVRVGSRPKKFARNKLFCEYSDAPLIFFFLTVLRPWVRTRPHMRAWHMSVMIAFLDLGAKVTDKPSRLFFLEWWKILEKQQPTVRVFQSWPSPPRLEPALARLQWSFCTNGASATASCRIFIFKLFTGQQISRPASYAMYDAESWGPQKYGQSQLHWQGSNGASATSSCGISNV